MNKKRVAVAILWIYSCYAAGGLAEYMVGAPAFIGLAIGVAAAIFFGLDPFGVVWPKAEGKADSVEASPAVETGAAVGSPVWQ